MHPNESMATWGSRTSLIATILVILGFLLTGISWWFLLISAVGAFGPGILREMNWLHDKDEFQLQAIHRAGYHAYIATGLMALVLVAFLRSNDHPMDHSQDLATLFLVTLGFTWFLSSLIGYWGAQKGTFRILLAFGFLWLVFAILSNIGKEWTGWTALLLHPLLALPFFGLAWLSLHRPKIAAGLLFVASAFFFQFFGLFQRANISIVNQGVTFMLFIGPMLACGLALLARDSDSSDE